MQRRRETGSLRRMCRGGKISPVFAPRRIDSGAAGLRRIFGVPGGRRGSSGGRDSSTPDLNGARLSFSPARSPRLRWTAAACAPDPPSDARCHEIRTLRHPADGLCCACAERRAARGSCRSSQTSSRPRGKRTTRPRRRTGIGASCSDQRSTVFSGLVGRVPEQRPRVHGQGSLSPEEDPLRANLRATTAQREPEGPPVGVRRHLAVRRRPGRRGSARRLRGRAPPGRDDRGGASLVR